ncbi:hypothetical protein BU15DRAFT_87096 [Melanogaster broomeanus]|nr:hypothetical protein BU15DRAFT_87096 [Melanogaster broomeanus]
MTLIQQYTRSPTSLKPYLQLPHLLSLAWLAYPILSLIFVIFRLQLSSAESQTAVANAKDDLLTACQASEQAATAAASIPRYMAIATNQQFADAVNGTMNGARAVLILALTMMEAIINFLIDIYRSTFLCFLELVVVGGLGLLISAVQEARLTAVNSVNSINPFGDIQAPQFNVSSLDALSNITIPTDFENALVQLNNSLPTVSSIKDSIQDLVDSPFEAVKADINNTFIAQNTVSFCSNLDTSSVDNLGNDLLQITKIGTVILIAVLFLLLVGYSALEWYKWRCLQNHLQYTPSSKAAPSVTLTDHNLLMLQADGQHPLLTRIANTLSARLRFTTSQHIHLRWFLHYIFHPPALACFLIGFFGLLSVQIQLIAIAPLEAKYSAETAASVQDFTNTIATQINSSMYNQSAAYASGINTQVDTAQSTINNGLFGWVNGTTTTLNDTLNNFYTDVQNIVSSVFNGTILETPAQDFVKCLIGSKVDALEEALTFLNENLIVDLPRVNDSILVLSPTDVNEITQPIATAAVGGGQNDSQGLIGRLVATYVDSLKQERLMFSIFMAGIAIVFWHSYAKNWVEAYKKRKWHKEQRGGLEEFVTPFKDGAPMIHVRDAEKGESESAFRSFTPLPEPRSAFSINPFRRSTQPPQNHPLKSLEPKFEKSWDSFFQERMDTKQSQPSALSRAISRPVRMMNLGKKKGDDDMAEKSGAGASEEKPRSTWFRPVTGLFSKKATPEPLSEFVVNRPVARPRPQLTISIDEAVMVLPNDFPKVDTSPSPACEEPSSAWSVSPTPPTLPWMKSIPPKKAPPRNMPRRHRHRVPMRATRSHTDPSPLAMPLYSAFEERPAAQQSVHLALYPTFLAPFTNDLPVSPQKHMRSSTVSGPIPVTPPLPATAVNPFATPFDDDAAAASPMKAKRITNPFTGFAL